MSDESEMHELAGAYSPPVEPAAPEPWSHPWHDQLGLRYHRAIAEKIRRQPELRGVAIENIDRWMARNDYPPGPRRALMEWRDFLVSASVDQIVERMTDPSERGHQRRQNTPFAGILSDTEQKDIREQYEQETTR